MNKTGIHPTGRRVLVKPDKIEEVTEGGILLPSLELKKHQDAQSTGIFIDAGPDCLVHDVVDVHRLVEGEMKLVERRITKHAQEPYKFGDRVFFAKHGGAHVTGLDGEKYRILNDTDITGFVDPGVNFAAIPDARKAVGI